MHSMASVVAQLRVRREFANSHVHRDVAFEEAQGNVH
jgi:hypothetical protein